MNKLFIIKNKNVLITGRKKIRITEIMKLLSKMLKIKSKPEYEKITKYGHYNISPYTYKKKPEIKYFPKKKIEIKRGLTDLVNELTYKRY